jgi:6-phosphogluconate dehydrogenase
MGANMVRRLQQAGIACVVHDRSPEAVAGLCAEGATGAGSLRELVRHLERPRVACLMLPAALVDAALDELVPQLERGDIIVDGGNSHFQDDIARAHRLGERGLHYVDMGTSGGVRGLERGYCLMIGGEAEVVASLDPFFAALAPGAGSAARTAGRNKPGSTAEQGYLHCGPAQLPQYKATPSESCRSYRSSQPAAAARWICLSVTALQMQTYIISRGYPVWPSFERK